MVKRGIWEVVPTTRVYAKRGKGPMSVRWVDTNKGREGNIIVRSRLVARDFKGNHKRRNDVFAQAPLGSKKGIVQSLR